MMLKLEFKNFNFQSLCLLSWWYLLPVSGIILFLIWACIYYTYPLELRTKLERSRQEELSLYQELGHKYALKKSLPLYLTQLQNLIRLESQISSRFPSSDELPGILILINQLAVDSRVTIISLTPTAQTFSPQQIFFDHLISLPSESGLVTDYKQQVVEDQSKFGGKIRSQVLRLSLSADYLDFVKFVYKIAQAPRVMEITNLQLLGHGQSKINVTCDIMIFYNLA